MQLTTKNDVAVYVSETFLETWTKSPAWPHEQSIQHQRRLMKGALMTNHTQESSQFNCQPIPQNNEWYWRFGEATVLEAGTLNTF